MPLKMIVSDNQYTCRLCLGWSADECIPEWSVLFFKFEGLRIRITLHMVHVSPAVFIASAFRLEGPHVIHQGHEALFLR